MRTLQFLSNMMQVLKQPLKKYTPTQRTLIQMAGGAKLLRTFDWRTHRITYRLTDNTRVHAQIFKTMQRRKSLLVQSVTLIERHNVTVTVYRLTTLAQQSATQLVENNERFAIQFVERASKRKRTARKNFDMS